MPGETRWAGCDWPAGEGAAFEVNAELGLILPMPWFSGIARAPASTRLRPSLFVKEGDAIRFNPDRAPLFLASSS
jgi:hypothetical protein